MSDIARAIGSAIVEKVVEKLTKRKPAYFDNGWNQLLGSSNLDAFMYDSGREVLTIRFKGGRDYEYYQIPPDWVVGLATAGSPGGWWHAHLKGAPFTKL